MSLGFNLGLGFSQTAGAGEAPFAPTDIAALNGWFDFSDTSTITTSGNVATTITDKSGGTSLTAVSGNGADSGTRTLNGLNVLDFLPTEHYNASIPYLAGHALFFVVEFDDVTTVNLLRLADTSGTIRLYLISSARMRVLTDGFTITGSFVHSLATTYIIYLECGTGGATLYINGGAADVTTAVNAGLTRNLPMIGGHSSGMNGAIGEVCAFELDNISLEEKNQVGNYLASKWAGTWTDIT